MIKYILPLFLAATNVSANQVCDELGNTAAVVMENRQNNVNKEDFVKYVTEKVDKGFQPVVYTYIDMAWKYEVQNNPEGQDFIIREFYKDAVYDCLVK